MHNSFLSSRQIASFKGYFGDQDIKMNAFLIFSKHATQNHYQLMQLRTHTFRDLTMNTWVIIHCFR